MEMRPHPSDTTIRLPITFDYQGGRRDSKKGNIITTVVLIFVFILVMAGTLRSDKGFFMKLLVLSGALVVVSTWLRFKVYHETTYSDAYESLVETDFTPSTRAFWGIYEVDDYYPYISHYKSGVKGIFVQFEKDVVVGKPETVMFDHYEAIGDALMVAGSTSLNVVHIDFMDNIGNDPRLDALFGSLRDCTNQDLKDVLYDIYSNLQHQMSQDYASYDVYLFTGTMKDETFWYNASLVISRLSESNYVTYKVLNLEGIRKTAQALLNLKEFSAKDACSNAFISDSYTGIIPISLYKEDGTEVVYNRTTEEKRQDAMQKLEEQKRIKAEKKARPLKEKIKSKFVVFIFIFNLIKKGVSSITSARKFKKDLKKKQADIDKRKLSGESVQTSANKSNVLLRNRKKVEEDVVSVLPSEELELEEQNIDLDDSEVKEDKSNDEEINIF